MIFSTVGVLISAYLTVLWFMGEGIGNRPLLILGVLLIIVGFQSVSLGLIAELIARTSYASTEPPYSIARESRGELLQEEPLPEEPDGDGGGPFRSDTGP